MKGEGGRMKLSHCLENPVAVRGLLLLPPSYCDSAATVSSFILPLSSLLSAAFILALQRDANRLHDFVQDGFGFFAATHCGRVARADGKPVCEDGNDEAFDIVWQTVRSFFSERERLGRPKQRKRAARADSQVEHLGSSGRGDDSHQIINQR